MFNNIKQVAFKIKFKKNVMNLFHTPLLVPKHCVIQCKYTETHFCLNYTHHDPFKYLPYTIYYLLRASEFLFPANKIYTFSSSVVCLRNKKKRNSCHNPIFNFT